MINKKERSEYSIIDFSLRMKRYQTDLINRFAESSYGVWHQFISEEAEKIVAMYSQRAGVILFKINHHVVIRS
jgi:hypothetical protein